MRKTNIKYFFCFLLYVVCQVKVFSQEAIRIFDIRKKTTTYSLADLKKLGDENDKKKESASVAKTAEDEATHFSPIYTVDFTKDNRSVLSGGTDGVVQIWSILSGKKMKKIACHQGRVLCAKFFIGNQFFSTSDDGTTKLINGSNGKILKKFIQEGDVKDEKSMAIVGGFSINIDGNGASNLEELNEQKNKTTSTLSDKTLIAKRSEMFGHKTVGSEQSRIYNTCLAYSNNKKLLVVGSTNAVLTLYNIEATNTLKILRGHADQINCVLFVSNKTDIISGSNDKNLILWQWEKDTSIVIRNAHDGSIRCLAMPNNTKVLASGGDDNIIKIWNLTKMKISAVLEGHDASITALAFTKDGKYIVSASKDNSIRIWDVRQTRPIKVYQMQDYPINTMAISYNENFIIAGGLTNGTAVRLYSLKSIIKEYEQSISSQ